MKATLIAVLAYFFEPSPETVLNACYWVGIKEPAIVTAQSMAETGNYRCSSCSLQRNNLFGFKTGKLNYIEFDNWIESVLYYKRWQDKYYKGGDYFEFLKRIGYASADNYKRLVIGCLRNVCKPINLKHKT